MTLILLCCIIHSMSINLIINNSGCDSVTKYLKENCTSGDVVFFDGLEGYSPEQLPSGVRYRSWTVLAENLATTVKNISQRLNHAHFHFDQENPFSGPLSKISTTTTNFDFSKAKGTTMEEKMNWIRSSCIKVAEEESKNSEINNLYNNLEKVVSLSHKIFVIVNKDDFDFDVCRAPKLQESAKKLYDFFPAENRIII